jgi:DUF917 family protein
MWQVTVEDVQAIAVGAGILGAGGGGDPYLGQVQLTRLLREGRTVTVVAAEAVADDDLGCGVSGMGAPTVGIEKLPRGDEMWQAVRALEEHMSVRFRFLVVGEVGGGNAIEPLIAAAYGGLPVVDADPMGRAFPELQMDTFMIGGVRPWPFAVHDAQGNSAVFGPVTDARTAERLGRAVTVAMGGSAALALPVLTGRELKTHGILGTLSLVRRLGRAVLEALAAKDDPVAAIARVVPASVLFTGKVADVERRTTGGFARGRVVLEGLGGYAGESLAIDIQNEYLVAYRDGEPVATVPDIIALIEEESGLPVGTEALRYGLRLTVVGIPAAAKLKTPAALAVIGPRAFGYDVDFRPLPGDLPEVPLVAGR